MMRQIVVVDSGGGNLMGVLLNTGINTLRLAINDFDANGVIK